MRFEGLWAEAACVVSTSEGFRAGFYFEEGLVPSEHLGLLCWSEKGRLVTLDRETLRELVQETAELQAAPGVGLELMAGLSEAILMLSAACRNAKCEGVRYLVQVDGEWAKARYVDGELVAEVV